jgi:hypothetical protein
MSTGDPRSWSDDNAKIAARLGSGSREGRSFKLTVDTNLRVVTLPEGGWRLHGFATQVFYLLRSAKDSAGTLSDGEAAPAAGDLVESTAGAAAGKAYSSGDLRAADSNGAARGAIPLPTDPTQWNEIPVKRGRFVNLYLKVAAGSANPILVGPFE